MLENKWLIKIISGAILVLVIFVNLERIIERGVFKSAVHRARIIKSTYL